MPRYKFVVRLKEAHENTGLSSYMVSKHTGISINMIERYAKNDAIQLDRLNVAVIALADFYGVEFYDAVQVVKVEDDESPENETLVADVA